MLNVPFDEIPRLVKYENKPITLEYWHAIYLIVFDHKPDI